MKNIFYTTAITVLAVMAIFGCSTDDEVESQKTAIEKELGSYDSTHVDRFDGVYRYIVNRSREGRDSEPFAKNGDVLHLYFDMKAYGTSQILWTNKEDEINNLMGQGLDAAYWSTDALRVKLGETKLSAGLTEGLLWSGNAGGCAQGDTLMLYVTSDKLNGDKQWGYLAEDTAIVWNLIIDKIEK